MRPIEVRRAGLMPRGKVNAGSGMTDSDPHATAVAATVGNRAEEIGRIAQLVRGFGAAHGLAPETVHDFCVAFDELLSNIVKYGHKDDARHEISVRLELLESSLVAEISDDGEPFDPFTAPAPQLTGGINERPIGGLGIYFVRKLMDEVSYARRDGRNVVVMRKRLARRAGA
jgi:anti-sigma regulatory factor (Ser/Thr protein kinase)